MSASPDLCADALLRAIPAVMQAIRQGMRAGRGPELTIPQFRTLAFVDFQPGASLAEAAAHVGLGAPTMSVLVSGLVERGVLRRSTVEGNRRQVRLELTAAGQAMLRRAKRTAHDLLAQRLRHLPSTELDTLCAAAESLHTMFTVSPPSADAGQNSASP
jgi:DNA-binding MarR family transcriptional regulator